MEQDVNRYFDIIVSSARANRVQSDRFIILERARFAFAYYPKKVEYYL
jgi:hypothetical protein